MNDIERDEKTKTRILYVSCSRQEAVRFGNSTGKAAPAAGETTNKTKGARIKSIAAV
jgi:hypothetical protein